MVAQLQKPDDRLPLNQVIEGDCLEILAGFPSESIDMIFADPPYNLQLDKDLWRPNLTRVDAVDADWDRFRNYHDYDQFTRAWLSACRRVLKRNGTLWVIGTYHNIFRIGAALQDLDFWILNDVVWIKTNPMPNFRGVRFTNAHETLIWAQKERGAKSQFNYHTMKSLNEGLQMRSDWTLPLCTGKERLRINGEKAHPTQKPEVLLYRIILSSTEVGDVVLDPFFGTGTTGAMAKKLHRKWIGIERELHYVQLARRRINDIHQVEFDPPLFWLENPRKLPRVSFGSLLEYGLLEPGQKLYFEGKTDISARVLANGLIEYKGKRGSIHQIARSIRSAPCNGWILWQYRDEKEGVFRPVDFLRKIIQTAKQANQSSGDENGGTR